VIDLFPMTLYIVCDRPELNCRLVIPNFITNLPPSNDPVNMLSKKFEQISNLKFHSLVHTGKFPIFKFFSLLLN